jgi:hypothetical protein
VAHKEVKTCKGLLPCPVGQVRRAARTGLKKLGDWKECIVQDRAPDYCLIRIGDDGAAVKRRRQGRNFGRLGKIGPQSSQMLGELRRGMRPRSTKSEDVDAYWLDLYVAKARIIQYRALGD